MFISLRNQVLKIILLLTCLGSLILHLCVPINLTAVDIGRHIKNGELILQGQGQVLYKNFYSFSYPDYAFINHHWFFGVISYLIYKLSGFDGLSTFYIFLLTLTLLLAFDSARRYSNYILALFVSVLSLLMLSSRAEIRPEGFSVFLVAFDFWLLQRFLQGEISKRLILLIIPAVQVFWVNTHIFFLMGPVLVGFFLWQAKLNKENMVQVKVLQQLILLTIFVNLINPSGLWGMLTPLNGFKKFGYELAENQTVFFMIHRFGGEIVYKYFIAAAIVLIIGMLLRIRLEGAKAMPLVILGALVTIVTFRAVRLIMPFGFLFIPLTAYYYAPYFKKTWLNYILGIVSIIGLFCYMWLIPVHPKIGLMPNVNASAEL